MRSGSLSCFVLLGLVTCLSYVSGNNVISNVCHIPGCECNPNPDVPDIIDVQCKCTAPQVGFEKCWIEFFVEGNLWAWEPVYIFSRVKCKILWLTRSSSLHSKSRRKIAKGNFPESCCMGWKQNSSLILIFSHLEVRFQKIQFCMHFAICSSLRPEGNHPWISFAPSRYFLLKRSAILKMDTRMFGWTIGILQSLRVQKNRWNLRYFFSFSNRLNI